MIIERDEIRNPESQEFLGYGAPTGELVVDQQHNKEFSVTDGWMDFDVDENEWFRTGWDTMNEEWYSRDNYRGFNPWKVPKYGPEPKENEVSDERVDKKTKTSVVSRIPEQPVQQRKSQITVQPQQQVVTNRLPSKRRGRSNRIQEN